jgi:two-component system, cell cycle response regulator
MESKTILIIEDNALNMKLVRALLQKGQFRILEATTAEQGIQIARENHPDLILMDIQLPGMDGLSATRRLKEDPLTKDIQVAALTSYAMEGDIEKAKEAGCIGYISKPIDTRKFLDTVQKLTRDDSPSGEETGPAFYRKRLLIVDDEPLNIKLLAGRLPADKFEIIRAFDGKTGLEKAAELSPDLILLDIMMPGMDGCEVTRRLKSDPALKEIPIIIITALGGVDDKLKALEAGADEFLTKPVQPVEVLSRIRSLILSRELEEQYLTRTQVEGLFRAGGAETDEGGAGLSLQTVLIVDDDPRDAKLIQYYLNGLPVRIEFAQTGEDGLNRILHK